ncbi:MAG: TolC family protein [Candidatus Omnitrophica bacterium]|nr:TolC family protein [Candidatus Omnitrophota bacterium]
MMRLSQNLKIAGGAMIAVLALSSRAVSDDGPLTLSLKEVIRVGAERNIQVIVANARVRQAVARIEQQSSAFIPQFTGTIAQKRQTRDIRASGLSLPTSEEVLGPSNIFDARLALTQTIFDPAAIERLKAAQFNKNWSDAQLRKIQQDVFALVATLFVHARSASQEEKLWQFLEERDRKHMEIAKTRNQSGTGSSVAWKQAKADYAESVYRHRAAVREAEEWRLDLLAALGFSSKRQVTFLEDDNLPPALFPSSEHVEDIMKDQPDVESAQRAVEQKQAEYQTEKAGYWPKIAAFADYGPSGVGPNDANGTYAVGVQASVPVFEGGLRQAKIQEAESRLKESRAVAADARLQVETTILTAAETVHEISALVEARTAMVEVAEQYLEQARQRAQNGSASALDLTDAIAQRESAVYDRQAAQAAYVIARVNLARAMGDVQILVNDTPHSP